MMDRPLARLLRVLLALAVVFAAALGCDAIPINLPDPKLGSDSGATALDSSEGSDGGVTPSADRGVSPAVDFGSDAPAQPWVDLGWNYGDGAAPPPLDGGPCLDDGGDGSCPAPDAAPDLEAGLPEGGTRLSDAVIVQ